MLVVSHNAYTILNVIMCSTKQQLHRDREWKGVECIKVDKLNVYIHHVIVLTREKKFP